MPFRVADLKAAVRHVRQSDPVMRGVIDRVGDCRLRPRRDRFSLLARAIVSQQISASAARTIYARLEEAASKPLTPQSLGRLAPAQLKAAGVSPQKIGYLGDLARQVETGAVQLAAIGRLSDEQVIEQLTQIRGIGRWTAKMFLIFGLGRLDVFPHDDLGVRAALQKLHALKELPGEEDARRLAQPWRPYATIGSWYCWRFLELDRRNA